MKSHPKDAFLCIDKREGTKAQNPKTPKPQNPKTPCIGFIIEKKLKKLLFNMASLTVVPNTEFQHILRIQNTNVKGKEKVVFAMTAIKGIGRRISNLALKLAEVDINKRAGELTEAEINKVNEILSNPTEWGVPKWFLNRQSDPVEGTASQLIANQIDSKLRDDTERLKKIRAHRGLRHYWGLKVR